MAEPAGGQGRLGAAVAGAAGAHAGAERAHDPGADGEVRGRAGGGAHEHREAAAGAGGGGEGVRGDRGADVPGLRQGDRGAEGAEREAAGGREGRVAVPQGGERHHEEEVQPAAEGDSGQDRGGEGGGEGDGGGGHAHGARFTDHAACEPNHAGDNPNHTPCSTPATLFAPPTMFLVTALSPPSQTPAPSRPPLSPTYTLPSSPPPRWSARWRTSARRPRARCRTTRD